MNQRLISVAFAASIFLSAFLLFQIQPLISKAILPWFGGSTGVWTTCVLFFQTVLLGGYLYAHILTDRFSLKWQASIHGLLLLCVILFLHVLPDPSWKPNGSEVPVAYILVVLSVTVGLPYFVLSTSGPLLQAWFGNTFPGRSPYRLYALSNVGSLLALLSYPFLFEPVMGMSQQALLWSRGFLVLAVMCGACALIMCTRSVSRQAGPNSHSVPVRLSTTRPGSSEAPSSSRRWQWFGLSMVASVMLLATTNRLCQDVAVVPFLWVAPLSLYLLTFILCFDGEGWYSRLWYGLGGAFSVGLVTLVMIRPTTFSFTVQILVYLAGLFVTCMVCHGELARRKPAPDWLTTFYLTVAAGGAFGGIFVGVISPLIFPMFLEMHLILLVCCVLTVAVYLDENAKRKREDQLPVWARVATLGAIFAVAFHLQSHASEKLGRVIEIERNFYGVLRVAEKFDEGANEAVLGLWHGAILHGVQFTNPDIAATPTTYYGAHSGIGRVMGVLQLQREALNVGVVGLGVGTLAAYGRAEDTFRFYEINEAVVRFARNYFTFVDASPALTEVIIGDARLILEREADQLYDLLVLDAFSGDSVPTHLLTREAVEIYQRHLKADGVLAMHLSNLHFDLGPVAAALAEQAGLSFLMTKSGFTDQSAETPSTWLLASRDTALLGDDALRELHRPPPERRVLWTDDFSNLFKVLQSGNKYGAKAFAGTGGQPAPRRVDQ